MLTATCNDFLEIQNHLKKNYMNSKTGLKDESHD